MKNALKGVCLFLSGGLLLAAAPAPVWNATGHMITSSIAERRLEADVKVEVERLIGILADFEPELSDLVPAAAWMDVIKQSDEGLLAFNDWHYFDQPYNPFGLPGVEEPSGQNVVWAIGQAAATLGSPKATDFEKALMLRMLIHFMGDLHQPLHVTNRITIEQRTGDFGANLFDLSGGGARNLHSFWDGTAGLFPYVDPQGDWSSIERFALQIEQDIAPPDSLLHSSPGASPGFREIDAWITLNAKAWAYESYGQGVEAYVGIEPHTAPGAEYTARAQAVIKQRLAYGGYRLAAILNAVVKYGMADVGEI